MVPYANPPLPPYLRMAPPQRQPWQVQKTPIAPRTEHAYKKADALIQSRWPRSQLKARNQSGYGFYDLSIEADTLKHQSMPVVGYQQNTAPTPQNMRLQMMCSIDHMSRWDKANTPDWSNVVASTFTEPEAVNRLNKARTVLLAYGKCRPSVEAFQQLTLNRWYEYHAAFVPVFEDNQGTGVMMEIGTSLRLTPSGATRFDPARVELTLLGYAHRDVGRITIR